MSDRSRILAADPQWLRELKPAARGTLLELANNYLAQDQLQDYRAYPKQFEFHAAGKFYPNRLLRAGNQQGKAIVHGTPVLTLTGFTPIEDLVPGDFVYGSDGRPTKVEGVFPQGERECWEVTASDMASLVVDGEHLWTVRKCTGHQRSRKWTLKTTKELMATTTRWDLPPRPMLEHPETEHPIDPYLLGLLLGDGGMSTSGVVITTADQEIIDYCAAMGPEHGFRLSQSPRDTLNFRLSRTGKSFPNPLTAALRDLGLMGKTSHDKFVPDRYLRADAGTRLAILRGLMDTDGTTDRTPGALRSFSSVSLQLAQDVEYLVRSLGMQATVRQKKGRYKGAEHLSWRVNIRTGGESLFNLPRKRAIEQEYNRPARNLLVRDIEPAGRHECTCIKVSNEDGIFLAGEGLVPTHNTFSAANETAMHLTGEYPPGWEGYRFQTPIVCWCAGETADATRDNPQFQLLGAPKRMGTGRIPKRCLTGQWAKAKGVADLFDYVMIRHITGGLSMLRFRYYAQQREAWQGPKVNLIWFDEEPPIDIYNEGLARTLAAKGITMLTFTPLLGYSDVVKLYLDEEGETKSGRHVTTMTIRDALHMDSSEEGIARAMERFPDHQLGARIWGDIAVGEGQVYPYSRKELQVKPFEIPDYWPRIAGIDFGGSTAAAHPTAAVLMTIDPDDRTIYVVADYRAKGRAIPEHWHVLRDWGKNLLWSWPKDGSVADRGSGVQYIQMFRDEGMRALPEPAHFPVRAKRKKRRGGQVTPQSEGTKFSVERGILGIEGEMKKGKFKIFSTCKDTFEEISRYRREDMQIVKENDDIMDAVRYAYMSLRYAKPKDTQAVHIDNSPGRWPL